ncbi:fungal-specific transcription factor domain-containing protein [Penicillium cinerascens]|uniref:Fungal-specific transcription factor domain-containing protein n=1 Tax=Penicillium cinerascens TaxID=70096 RepID=A0A9W9MMY1_9EURO|nr:fungal-specific transcription factor domain-containing protein [Penicillium cinerascens]KAJ5204223.1 fungal-specific transcription factor domain-containing protein [Penicillium cinerascens]
MGFTDAACLTCRKKSRRCDRARPNCRRCISKGLQCEGYPDKFRFCGIASRGKWKNREAPIPAQITPEGSSSENPPQVNHNNEQSGASATVADTAGLTTPMQSLTPSDQRGLDKLLASVEVETLLAHYDQIICPHQIAQLDGSDNPYRLYVLPLAYEQIGLLYAVLGLSACHLGRLKGDSHLCESAAVDYRLKAITALGRTIKKVGSGAFDENECDGVFATIQILLLHDLKLDQTLTVEHKRTVFFLGNLVWLDIIRAFSTPERLCFTQDLRKRLLSLCDLRFESVNGCPREIVFIIGEILERAKAHSSGRLEATEYEELLQGLVLKLYHWDSSRCFYPSDDPLWLSVAEAFRHTCILRSLRLLDATESAAEARIQESVAAILDSLANIPGSSALVELSVMPLFMAGADCLSPHSRHYILLRLAEINGRSEMGIEGPKTLLEKVWRARAQQPKHDRSNVPWMLFTHNSESAHQDDYLII